ncbi:receptor-type tyrosine-protein phosphatase mu-like isoform X1 [Watersipora subatra]|uniref:receptor-type tyrosine-protein phosphatase mu-like isoform X1 n=1 Tax=Watersipora subatra TaxID=2589382 RepID=UPI00355B20A1
MSFSTHEWAKGLACTLVCTIIMALEDNFTLPERSATTVFVSGYSSTVNLSTVASVSTKPTCIRNHFKVKGRCLPCGCARKKDCEAVTGKCSSDRCRKGRYDLTSACVFGIVSIRNDKANPLQPTNATCVIRTMDAETDTSNVMLTIGSNQQKYKTVSKVLVDENTLEAVFFIKYGLRVGDNITCQVELEDGQIISRTSSVILYDLPGLSRSPEIHSTSFTRQYLSLRIHKWDPSKGDTGDGPVIRYGIKVCQYTESQRCRLENLESFKSVVELPAFSATTNPVSILMDFLPGANYSFIYRANRAGMYGSPSPPLFVQMPCKEPKVGPDIHKKNYTMEGLAEKKKVNVTFSWQLPPTSEVQCNYISEVLIHLTSDRTNLQSVVGGYVTTYTIALEPYTEYTVSISYRNDGGLDSPVDTLQMNRTLPALPDAPVVTQVYMHNSSSARVHWSSSLFPNGKLLGYQVLYSDAVKASDVACTALPTNSSCLITGLKFESVYNFTVRAENSVGWGEESARWEYRAVLSVPGPVTTLQNSSRTDESIYLEWKEPENTGGTAVTSYQVRCEHADFTIMHIVPLFSLPDNELIGHNLTGLAASTNYSCYVLANNTIGVSLVAHRLVVFTLPPEPKAPPMPVIVEEKSTENTFAVELKAASCCRLHRVVVMEADNKVKRSMSIESRKEVNPESCGQCCTGSCYIAGELLASQLPMVFTVGNNMSYRGYRNTPLSEGRSYKLWYGAGDEVDGVAKFTYVFLSQPVVATPYVEVQSSLMSSAALIGIVVAVSVCALILVVVLMVFIRHRRNKMFKFRTPVGSKVEELNENGKLLTNGTYQKGTYRLMDGDALSVDSLDYSKQPDGEPVYDNVRLKHYAIMVEELQQYIELKSADDGFKKEYNHIPWGLKFSHNVAKHPDNKMKNRYGNIIAYDHSRVILKGKNLDHDTDYINASYIDGYTTPKEYIATQGPNKFTVSDLWHMAWQEGTAIIVMVTNTIELTKHKCEQYWPEEGSKQYGPVRVTLTNSKSLAHYKIRTFSMEQNDEVRKLKQFHFTAWPDHGTPTHATTLLSFLKKVRQQKTAEDGPIICHCSAGVGRSGTFIALDSLLQQAESEGKVDVYSYVTRMRQQRCNMIQTLNQYIFLHEAILEASEGFDSTIRLSEFKSEYQILKEKRSKNKSQLDLEYQKLKDMLHVDRSTDASSSKNQPKNRQAIVVPLNDRRVPLVNCSSNYINASYIDDHRKRSAIIATQHPLSSTVEDFWMMVLSQRPFALLTLCAQSASAESTGKQDLPIFWPSMECRTKEFASMSIELLDEQSVDQSPRVYKQSLRLHNKSEEVFQPEQAQADVDHYMCKFWSSQKELPSEMESFVKLVAMLERRKQESGDRMIVVNCFDGAKQCGLYIACHSLLQAMTMDSEVDIPETIRLLRNDQPMFISALEQFEFCYKFVSDYLESSYQDSAVFTCL